MKINNYFEYHQALRSNRVLSSSAKIVALMIASHFNWVDDNPAFPSVETLADECGISASTVKRAKAELVKEGWLSQQRRYNNSNLYVPSIPTAHTDLYQIGTAHGEPRHGSHRPVQRGHNDLLKDKLKDNLKDNNEIKKSEGILLDNLSFDITKYLDNDISINKIKEEVEDKEEYFLIIKERAKLGIYG